MDKYRFTNEFIIFEGQTLFRIQALRDIGEDVKAGDYGGYVAKHSRSSELDYSRPYASNKPCLSQTGECWVYDEAKVLKGSKVMEDAQVRNFAIIGGQSEVRGKAIVGGSAIVDGHAEIGEEANVSGFVQVCRHSKVTGRVKLRDYVILEDGAIACGNAELTGNVHLKGDVEVDFDVTGYVTLTEASHPRKSRTYYYDTGQGIIDSDDLKKQLAEIADEFKDFQRDIDEKLKENKENENNKKRKTEELSL